MANEHDIDNELVRQSREEAADDAMFDEALAADIGPQSAAPSSPARVEAQSRDARRLLDTPPDVRPLNDPQSNIETHRSGVQRGREESQLAEVRRVGEHGREVWAYAGRE